MAIELIAKIKPKNNGTFALVDAEDVQVGDKRLPDILPVFMTKAEYDALETKNPETLYFIVEEGTANDS